MSLQIRDFLVRHALRPVVFAIGLAALAEFWLPITHRLDPQTQPLVSDGWVLIIVAALGVAAGIVENLVRGRARRVPMDLSI